MKRMLQSVMAAGTLLVLGGAPLAAQAIVGSPIRFGITGGATVPISDLSDVAKTGWNAGALLDIGLPLVPIGYFLFIRPQAQAAKKAKETIGGAKTGDKVIMTNGIHGVIANIKDSTFVVKLADNVKIEVEKSTIDKVTRENAAPAKA